MELKPQEQTTRRKREKTFNRTSMELKRAGNYTVVAADDGLLIEPVWNWNSRIQLRLPHVTLTFNRTSMELKRRQGWAALSRLAAF